MKIRTTLLRLMTVSYLVAASACGGMGGFLDPAATQTSSMTSDYGDAPDMMDAGYDNGITAMFPTRDSSYGAHHNDATKVALGLLDENGTWPATTENDATDENDADGVKNIEEEPSQSDRDQKDDGLLTFVFGDDEEAALQFSATAEASATQTTYYVNALFDWNKDGVWSGTDANGAEEWAVKNHEVMVNPGESVVDRTEIFHTGISAHPVWLRLTISDTPIDESAFPNGWDGTGAFSLGETEDYFLTNNEVITLEDESQLGLPGVPVNPFNPRPLPGGGGGGGGGGGDTCDYDIYTNLTLCEGRSTTKLVTIGGFAPDSIAASSSNPSVASVSLNESNVTITGGTEGEATISVIATQGGCTYYLTVRVKVKKCEPAKKIRIECCTQEEIRRDPSQCDNCHVVGRQHNQSNTYGGGGTIPEVDMEGVKTNISKSYVIVRGGGLVDVVTVYYDCDPCPEEEEQIPEESYYQDGEECLDETCGSDFFESFFSAEDEATYGGDNGQIDNFTEYDQMAADYDAAFDDAWYECATRYFTELAESVN